MNIRKFLKDEETLLNVELPKNLTDSYLKALLSAFVFFIIIFLSFLFIRKDFSFLFFYGFFLFVVYSFLDLFIFFVLPKIPKISYPIFEDKLKSVFIVVRFLGFLIVVNLLYNLYLKNGNNYDYPIVIFSGLFVGYFFNLISKENDAFSFLINSSVMSFILLSLVTFGFKYLSFTYISNIVFLWIFFIIFVLLEQFMMDFNLFRNIILKRFFKFILYALVVMFFVYRVFKLNMFLFLIFLFSYLTLFAIFEFRKYMERYFKSFLFTAALIMLFIGKMMYAFVVGMSYEKMIIFVIFLVFPLVYYFLEKDKYSSIESIFLNKKYDTLDLGFVVKSTSLFFGFLCVLAFRIAHDYMVVYYGYSDSFNFMSVVIPLLFFYFFENYSSHIKKPINSFLDLVLNISVLVFSYSTQIVILSYLFGLNYTNLVSIFCLYLFLSILYSSNRIHDFVAMIYLLAVYVIIYV